MLRRTETFVTCCLLILLTTAALSAAKDKEFVPPRADNAATYASKDVHPNEKIAVGIDLYNAPPKSDIFITPYSQEQILPVFLVITNDSDHPVTVSRMQAELVTSNRTKLQSLTVDDIFRRVAHINASSTAPPRVGPIPLSGNKNKKAQKQYEEISSAIFKAEAVEPHTTRSGFLFFDVQGVKQPINGSNLYLTQVLDGSGNELMYFEIPLTPSNAAGQP